MLSVKQSGIKYHFLSLWYDLTWNWTPVSQTIGKHYTLGQIIKTFLFQAIQFSQLNSFNSNNSV